jgi:hypothetical protein
MQGNSLKMNLQERIQSLEKWGQDIANISGESRAALFQKVNNKNGWFTPESSNQAIAGILTWFKPGVLEAWTKNYELPNGFTKKSVGLVMAGNIPLVGFHDFLCVLISGNVARVKLSSQDDVLLPYLTDLLVKTDSRWATQFSFEERLNTVDAVIATGSDNSARYFEYYFRDKPKIIRKNRTSVGIIMGEENPDEFSALSKDVFTFYGLGCRNVSKIFIPEGFELKVLIEAFQSNAEIGNHNKYANNYDYQRAIRLISQKAFLDSGFFLLEKSEDMVSPISVIYYETYTTQKHLTQLLESKTEKIQCIVSARAWYKGSIPFGDAQTPALNDYADGVDTMKFLSEM